MAFSTLLFQMEKLINKYFPEVEAQPFIYLLAEFRQKREIQKFKK